MAPGSTHGPARMLDKMWSRHAILERPDGKTLRYMDRHPIHPKSMRISVEDELGFRVTVKDVILAIIRKIGAVGDLNKFAGPAIRSMSIEGRQTVCNISIEAA